MKTILCKHGSSLVAEDADSLDALAKIKDGALVLVEVRRKRNLQHNRLYFALIKKVHENMKESLRFPTEEILHCAIKIAVGLRTEFILPNGTVGFMPGTIKFGEMDQFAFDKFYNRVCNFVCQKFLPGVTSEALKKEVLEMIGHGRAS